MCKIVFNTLLSIPKQIKNNGSDKKIDIIKPILIEYVLKYRFIKKSPLLRKIILKKD